MIELNVGIAEMWLFREDVGRMPRADKTDESDERKWAEVDISVGDGKTSLDWTFTAR